jgi:transcriptional repressor of cell division inhibition gene dicB
MLYSWAMNKAEALRLLGGTLTAAAAEIGISPQAVNDWPEVLPPRIADRVLAALYRRDMASKRRRRPAKTPQAA